jgi:hypothetical protein
MRARLVMRCSRSRCGSRPEVVGCHRAAPLDLVVCIEQDHPIGRGLDRRQELRQPLASRCTAWSRRIAALDAVAQLTPQPGVARRVTGLAGRAASAAGARQRAAPRANRPGPPTCRPQRTGTGMAGLQQAAQPARPAPRPHGERSMDASSAAASPCNGRALRSLRPTLPAVLGEPVAGAPHGFDQARQPAPAPAPRAGA